MPNSFRIGDVVQPKDGGPKMIVIQVAETREESAVWCAWTEYSQKRNVPFRPDDLVHLPQ
ncbi:DUF2158 domain-containing protein [Chthonobacter albigriseus]|uniref:DUF2158 domain-containing protein n=1 Tax=Chthonobacter albigriseus TaxID=1683161 RepID=UPI0015EE8A44|nr:DUF2158 domain-containing protein [Chthonobacter albigriseus]